MSGGGEKVRNFCDRVGWKTIDGTFVDSLKFADRRPVVLQYFETIHRRTRAQRIGSGALQFGTAVGSETSVVSINNHANFPVEPVVDPR